MSWGKQKSTKLSVPVEKEGTKVGKVDNKIVVTISY